MYACRITRIIEKKKFPRVSKAAAVFLAAGAGRADRAAGLALPESFNAFVLPPASGVDRISFRKTGGGD